MPELDGIDICIELRKHIQLNGTLVVFYSQRDEDYSQIARIQCWCRRLYCKTRKAKGYYIDESSLKRYITANEPLVFNENGLIIDRERYLVFKDGDEGIASKRI